MEKSILISLLVCIYLSSGNVTRLHFLAKSEATQIDFRYSRPILLHSIFLTTNPSRIMLIGIEKLQPHVELALCGENMREGDHIRSGRLSTEIRDLVFASIN